MEISLVRILIAAASAVAIGFIWYHPKVFGTLWMRLANLSPEMMENGKKRMPLMAFFGFLASGVIAYVMSFMLPALVIPDWIGAVELSFWCWAGFVAPTMLGIVLWEQKPFTLYLLDAFYWLVALIAMAIILVF